MTRRLFRLLTTCVCFALLVPVAAACINDRESDKAEKEFKLRYLDPSVPKESPPAQPTPAPADRLLLAGATGGGAILLNGAVALTVLPGRRRA